MKDIPHSLNNFVSMLLVKIETVIIRKLLEEILKCNINLILLILYISRFIKKYSF